MSDLEFDVIIEDEDLFDEEAEKRFMDEFAPEPKEVPPKKEFVATKKALADLTRESERKRREKKHEEKMVANPSANFKNQVRVLGDHVIEWCNYKAQKGEWRHEYDMSQMDEVYYVPVLQEVRTRMHGVIILVEEKRRRITVEWGNNER